MPPYIDAKARESIASGSAPQSVGELTYVLTRLCVEYLARKRGAYRYADLAECVAALECAKHEFQRRVVDPYEDAKRGENGDVFEIATVNRRHCGKLIHEPQDPAMRAAANPDQHWKHTESGLWFCHDSFHHAGPPR